MQSELTALHGEINDFTILKQEFEQIRNFKTDKFITKIT